MNSTDLLAQFASRLRASAIPDPVRQHAKLAVLDTLGCGIFGSTLPWTRIAADTVADIDHGGTSLIWGSSQSVSPPNAALVNGTAVHGFELDDLHQLSIIHLGSTVLPAAIATAQHVADQSGEHLLTAVVAGYEVAARAGMSMGAAHLRQGWHPTATHGTLGAAVSAGVMLGLDDAQMAHALGIAASHASGLMASQYGSMVKRIHAGKAAQAGVLSALLAYRGTTGIENVLEAEYGGYCTTFSPTYSPQALTEGLGTVWQTQQVGFKPYSTNGSCHPSIDAVLDLRREHGFPPEDVERVEIRVSSATYLHVGWPYTPSSVTAAQMNLSYIVAVVITDGAALTEQFTEARIADPALLALSGRVTVTADPDIDKLGDRYRHATRMRIVMRDGRELTASRDYAKGSVHMPLTEAEIQEKYMRLATVVLPETQANRLLLQVADLEQQSLAELMSLLRPARA
jgi:2-methylcitrate dehydratase PrpD